MEDDDNMSTDLDESSSGRTYDIFRSSADTKRRPKTSGFNDQLRHCWQTDRQMDGDGRGRRPTRKSKVALFMAHVFSVAPLVLHFSLMNCLNSVFCFFCVLHFPLCAQINPVLWSFFCFHWYCMSSHSLSFLFYYIAEFLSLYLRAHIFSQSLFSISVLYDSNSIPLEVL